jgi:hypothetical protein
VSRVRFTVALAAALASTLLPTQASADPADDETILVEGQRQSVTRMVSDTINDAGVEALARFEDKICPGVVGLGLSQASKLADLIRANIAALGGKLQDPGCTPNATVILTENPVEFVKQFATTQPAFFTMTPRELEQFTTQPRPVASWHVTESRGRDGQELDGAKQASDRNKRIMSMSAATSVPMNAQVVRQSAATRLYTNTREDMAFGFVVIESDKLAGKTIRQLADLATLHLLLDVRQNAGARNRGSILSLFEDRPEGAAAPTGLSPVDRAMVQALYAPGENNRTASQQFAQIATAIRRSAGQQ